MVSVEEKITIEQTIRNSPKAFALFCYLNNYELVIPTIEVSETDHIYYSALQSLPKTNKNSFQNLYQELSKRQVVADQPIIYDNYLLFVLITGLLKFSLDNSWLLSVLKLRGTANEPERSISLSFLNLLHKNNLNTEGFSSITLAGLIKSNEVTVDLTLVQNAFQSNRILSTYIERDLFLASVYLFTNDYIILASISEERIAVKKFESVFLKRVGVLENLLYVFIVVLLFIIWYYLINRYPDIRQWATDTGSLLQLIGIGLFAFILNKIKFLFGKAIKLFFGYRVKK